MLRTLFTLLLLTPLLLASGGKPPAPQPVRPKVLVVAIDGADWRVVDALVARGHLPALAEQIARGARAALDCRPAAPTFVCFCPFVWGSAFTGLPAVEHGMHRIDSPSTDWKVPALWDWLAAAGGTTTLAAVHGSWPPPAGADWVLTKPALWWRAFEAFEVLPWPVAHAGLLDFANHTKPNRLLEKLRLAEMAPGRPPAWDAIAKDRAALQATLALERRRGKTTDLSILLFESTDKSQHVTWASVQPAPGDPIDGDALHEQAEAWRQAAGDDPLSLPPPHFYGTVASQYLEVDHWLAQVLDARRRHGDPYDYVVLLSDHGMERNPGAGLPGSHDQRTPAALFDLFLIAGPGVEAGTRLTGGSVFDIAPTLAYALGLPVPAGLPGRVLAEAFTAAHRAEHPLPASR